MLNSPEEFISTLSFPELLLRKLFRFSEWFLAELWGYDVGIWIIKLWGYDVGIWIIKSFIIPFTTLFSFDDFFLKKKNVSFSNYK